MRQKSKLFINYHEKITIINDCQRDDNRWICSTNRNRYSSGTRH